MSNPIIGLDLANKVGICVLSTNGDLLYSTSRSLSTRDPQERVLNLRKLLTEIMNQFSPGEMAIEDVFLPAKTSRKTPISLGELRGIARLSAAEHNIPVTFYAAKKIKMAITGSGNASKEDVIHWIQAEFNCTVADDNEADAISIAYTHLLMKRFEQSM